MSSMTRFALASRTSSLQDSFEPLPSWNGNTVNPFTEDSPHHPEAQDGDGDSTAPLHWAGRLGRGAGRR
jgi:hypothetical protein